MGILDNSKFMIMVCEMFYIQGMSQKDISEKLNVSRPQICRILAAAQETGLVTIHINYPNHDETLYQNKIIEKYGVAEVYVYDTGNLSEEDAVKKLAELSRDLFSIVIKNDERIGVMAGKTICHLANALPKSKNSGLEFVPLCGGTASSGRDWYANAIAQNFSQKTDGKYFILNAPQYLNDIEGKKFLINEPSIKEILDLGKTCTSALIGIGTVEINSTSIEAANFKNEDIEYLKSKGAVASICASYVDTSGNIINCESADKIIGQKIEDLHKTRKIGVAMGKSKVEAIKAVLKGKYLDVLITSLDTARLLI